MARKRTLQEIDQEIARLQQEAARLRESEKADVVARIKEAVAYYGITAADIGLARAGRPAAKDKGKAKGTRKMAAPTGRIKYRDEAGNSWSGIGRRPRWFLDALSGGKTEAELRA